MQQTMLHREVEERDKEHELDCTPHNEKTGTQGRKEVEVGTLLLGSDKKNVIVNYSLIYFLC